MKETALISNKKVLRKKKNISTLLILYSDPPTYVNAMVSVQYPVYLVAEGSTVPVLILRGDDGGATFNVGE